MLSDTHRSDCSEELVLYGLLAVIGAIPVIIAIVERVAFTADASLGLLMVGAGLVGAIAHLWQARRPPER